MNLQLNRIPGQKVLELGGGNNPIVHPTCLGGTDCNVDVAMFETPDGRRTVDFIVDMNKPFPIKDNDFDAVVSIFAFEHTSWRNIPQLISETYRVCKPGGRIVIVVPNTEEQMKYCLSHEEWTEEESRILFGDANYNSNFHASAWSPKYAVKLFSQAGFENITVQPYGPPPQGYHSQTDILIQAAKPIQQVIETPKEAESSTEHDGLKEVPKPPETVPAAVPPAPQLPPPEKLFNRDYFNGSSFYGGYSPFYWDVPGNELIARNILARRPESVLELGNARGYVIKRLEDAGVHVLGLDISEHCHLTRATDSMAVHNILDIHWPANTKDWIAASDGYFDLCFSQRFLEHIPEDKLPIVFDEMKRVSKRGLHGVITDIKDDGKDLTRRTLKPLSWWKERMPKGHIVVNAGELESGPLPSDYVEGDGKVKVQFGCAWTCFHHGWANTDRMDLAQFAQSYGYRFKRVDILDGIPFDSQAVDLIFQAHLLEHITAREGLSFLRDCRRILKPTGAMRITVPDTSLLTEDYSSLSLSDFDELSADCAHMPTAAAKLHALLVGGEHKMLYDEQTLIRFLNDSGFKAKRVGFRKIAPDLGNVEAQEQILKETNEAIPCLSLIVSAVPAT